MIFVVRSCQTLILQLFFTETFEMPKTFLPSTGKLFCMYYRIFLAAAYF